MLNSGFWIRIQLFAGLEVMDSAPDPKQEMPYQKSSKNHQKNKQFDRYDIKKRKFNIFFKKYRYLCFKMP
jgi:hypothetical protein